MRWVFLLLLMANGFYFLWWQQQEAVEQAADSRGRGDEVESLVLLKEADPGAAAQNPAPPPAPPTAPVADAPPAPLPEQCWRLGPFAQQARARAVEAALRDGGDLAVTVTAVEIPGEPDYWVHVGPFASRTEALARFHELRAKGIDSFLVRDGELTNAVSLGLFSSRQRAERAQRQYRSLEYPVKIHVLQRFREGYSVRAVGAVDAAGVDKSLASLPGEIPKKTCE